MIAQKSNRSKSMHDNGISKVFFKKFWIAVQHQMYLWNGSQCETVRNVHFNRHRNGKITWNARSGRRSKRERSETVCLCMPKKPCPSRTHLLLACNKRQYNSSDTHILKQKFHITKPSVPRAHTFPTINQRKEKRRIENSFVFLERVNMCVGFRLFLSLASLLLKRPSCFPFILHTILFFSFLSLHYEVHPLFVIFYFGCACYSVCHLRAVQRSHSSFVAFFPIHFSFSSVFFAFVLFLLPEKNVTFRHLHVFHFAWTNC